ncbi:MAG: primosomal protein N' [Desulfobacterales bacterium]|nr:MAG: primosomal protein N' [Desulfobacterales bacterium]
MTASPRYIEVAVALPVYNTYTYRVPQNLLEFVSIGKRALVPFGRRVVTGYILGDKTKIQHDDIKTILDILDEKPLFPASMIPFFKWTSDYYIHPIGDVIKCALPGGLNLYDFTTLSLTAKGEAARIEKSVTPLEGQILKQLMTRSCRFKDLDKHFKENIPKALLQSMERRGLIVLKRELKGGSTKTKMERYVSLTNADIPLTKLSEARKKIIESIKDQSEISVKKLTALVPSASKLIKILEQAGYVTIFQKKMYRDPFGEPILPDKAHQLTKEQNHAISTVIKSLGQKFTTYLLTGVTGSGKTEVYMQIAAIAMQKGFSVLVLVPEIALISQMERRFRARFGDCVAVLHSGLSPGERYDQWIRISRKEVNIAIGARSAIFAPFVDIGLIIVDEEHDTSYKQESGLKYNARDLAIVRAKLNDSVALLGSATPSLQSYHNTATKKFKEITLTKRVEKRPLPEITVIDLRKSRDVRGVQRFITPELHHAMETTLQRGEQVLIFLNRRGFASFPVCSLCGQSIQCKNCDISLTLHQRANAYKCHYCGFSRASVSNCTHCGSSKIRLLGLGTEKVEETIKAIFPNAKVARMDRDTTRHKGSIRKILKDLRNQSIDVLVGTQMVAKGHDFPNITLVGVICADLSLNFPDFRAGERTYQLLAQVAGRAGRGAVPGRVILQTYNPDHFSILSATKQDFLTFYNAEIAFRKSLEYPPFSRMAQLKISGIDKDKTRQHALAVGDLCHTLKQSCPSTFTTLEILGPIEALLSKIARRYRWQIILKSRSVQSLHQFLHQVWFNNKNISHNRSVIVMLDVDPFLMT